MMWYNNVASWQASQLEELAGNWAQFDSFMWFDRPEDAHNWYLFYTHNRDSSVLEESNAAIILQVLSKPEYSEDVREEDHNHFLVGWVKGFAVRCVGEDGKPTAAILQVWELAKQLETYPCLDEDDYSQRQSEEADRVWKNCYDNRDRIEYIRENRSQFEFHSFADLLKCVRGYYFCGYASELLGG
jgi:hypothetical protein